MAGSRRLTELSGRVLAGVRSCLDEDRRPMVVALSGGGDSAVLAWALCQVSDSVRAVHINHGWVHSDRLVSAAEVIAKQLDLPVSVLTVDTSAPGSPEAVARAARYEALEMDRTRHEVVATGHTSTDQAETLIGNLMWGTGVDGLQGIRRRGEGLIRPLLGASRVDVRELAALLGLPFVDDPANLDSRYRRVRIRRALTAWEADLAPGVADRLASTAELVADDVRILDQLAGAAQVESNETGVRISGGMLRSMDVAVTRRVVRRALREISGGTPGSQRDVEAVLAVADGGAPDEIAGGHRVERAGAFIHIGRTRSESESAPIEWALPGSTNHGGFRWIATSREGTPGVFPMSRWTQVFDAGYFDNQPAVLRPWRGADRLAIRGGHKAMREALSEAGVPPGERVGWPVLVVGNDVVWVPGVRRADVGWVSTNTARYLVISAEQEGRWKPVEY